MAESGILTLAQAILTSTSLEAGILEDAAFVRMALMFPSGIDSSGNPVNFPFRFKVTSYATDGALTIGTGLHVLTKAGVNAMTLAPPTAAQEGIFMLITSSTANAHTVTVTEGFGGGGGGVDIGTFANNTATGFAIVAATLHWQVVGVAGVTFA